VATSATQIRLRVLVLFIWLVVGVFVISTYTWSHYDGPPYTRRSWPQLGRDILFCLTVGDSDPGVRVSAWSAGSGASRPSPVDCDQDS
jgi:hypothetical protein